jgi:hypothetical protein
MGKNSYLVAALACLVICCSVLFFQGCETGGLPDKKPVMETGERAYPPIGYSVWKHRESKEEVENEVQE